MLILKSPPPLYRFKIQHLEIVIYSDSVIGVFDHHDFFNDKRCKDIYDLEKHIINKLKLKNVQKVINIVNKVINNKVFL